MRIVNVLLFAFLRMSWIPSIERMCKNYNIKYFKIDMSSILILLILRYDLVMLST